MSPAPRAHAIRGVPVPIQFYAISEDRFLGENEWVTRSQERQRRREHRGPVLLFVAWFLHDLEEAAMFPATCEDLADRTGLELLRMDSRQSWTAVGLMGVLVGFACIRGARTAGRSRLYRAVVAGLGAHVMTHITPSMLLRRYTAGAVSAVPIMLPGAIAAGRELAHDGAPLKVKDFLLGAAVLLPAAFASHIVVRAVMKRN